MRLRFGGTRGAAGAAMNRALPAALIGSPALARRTDRTLTEQLAARFAERIQQRLIAPGTRLPSVRECARRHGISPCTVVSAYDRLLAQGLVEARKQRGFFVREPAAGAASQRRGTPAPAPRAPLPVNATMLIRGMFQPAGAQPMPGLGTLPAEWLDPAMLASALRRVGGNGEAFLRYGDPAGEPRLRKVLAERLAEHGVQATPAQIVTAVGATHALDVITRTLTRAGDSVLVDEPGWAVEYARLRSLGLRLLPRAARRGRPRPRGAARTAARGAPAAPVRDRVGAAQPDRRLALARPRASPADPGQGARPDPRRGRHLRPPRARRTCRGWPRSTAWSARSTSRASRRSWRRAGASAISPPRRRWSSG